MKSAAVFAGKNGLDFFELRTSVVRIPEVSLRIREAQAILDSMDLSPVDLFGYITSDDEAFFRNSKLKSLTSAIVQVGLFDRLKKTQRMPSFLVGSSNGDSALLVCAGQMSFKDLVSGSLALGTLKNSDQVISEKVIPLVIEAAPLLSGSSLSEYQAYRAEKTADGFVTFAAAGEKSMDLKNLVASLITNDGVNQLVNLGPAQAIRTTDLTLFEIEDVESLDSIELDPMLGWFWRGMRPQALAQ